MIYGALAAIPIFDLDLSLVVNYLDRIAVITASLPVVKNERWWHVPVAGSAFEDAIAVLRVLVLSSRLGCERRCRHLEHSE